MVASLVITRTQMHFYLAARRLVNVFPLRPLGSVRIPACCFRRRVENKLSTGSDLSRLARTGRSTTRESFRNRQHARRMRYLMARRAAGLGSGLGRGLGVARNLGVGVGRAVGVGVAVAVAVAVGVALAVGVEVGVTLMAGVDVAVAVVVGVAVAVAVTAGVAVAVGVVVAVADAVGVGVGVPVGRLKAYTRLSPAT